MVVTLTYQWSELDQRYEFGVSCANCSDWTQWLWFYFGRLNVTTELFPYAIGVVVCQWNNDDPQYTAREIKKRMDKILEENKR